MLLRGFVCITVLGLASSACDRDAIEPDRTAIRLAPDSTFALVGDTVVLTASVIDQSGQPIVSAVIGWSSSDTTVAKVDASGRVIARARGSAIITAKVNTASSSVKIVVGQIEGCQGIGVTHTDTGLPNDSATWHARQSPHFIQGSFTVTNRLTIEAGAIVCGLPDSELLVKREGELIAAGRADRSIRFMATDTTRRWRGIIAGALTGPEGGGLVRLTHVHVEWTSIGVVSAFQSSVRIDSSRFRQTSVLASANFSNLDMRRSVVDTGNVSLISGTFEDNIVRGGALFVARNQGTFAPIAVNGGRIEGSPGTAFQVGTRGGIPPSVISTRPLRITGSRGKPVSAPIDAFLNIWPTRAAQDSLLGNANDTLVVWSAATAHSLYVRRELPWHVICGLPVCSSGFTVTGLTLEPGASIRLTLPVVASGKVSAVGTPTQPIHISSTFPAPASGGAASYIMRMTGDAQSEFTNVVLSNVFLETQQQHSARFTTIRTNRPVNLAAVGSVITDSEILDVGGFEFGALSALRLGAAGVIADRVIVRRTSGSVAFPSPTPLAAVIIDASEVQLRNCEITDNQNDGVRVLSGANVRINNCNIERNGGYGVDNAGTAVVDARGNWWGDPLGPMGPAGDGVNGNVDASQPLTAPRAPLARAGTITAAGAATLATADTVRLEARVQDAEGRVLAAEPLIWRVANANIAMTDPSEHGVIVGLRPGTTTVVIIARSDTTVRTTVRLTVTPGGPVYLWTREAMSVSGYAHAIWGSSGSDVYAALDSINLLRAARDLVHYDGTRWSRVDGITLGDRALVAGSSANDVYVQTRDRLARFDGTSWRTVAPTPPNLYSLWVPEPGVVFASAGGGKLWRYREGSWTELPADSGTTEGSLWGRSSTDMYLANSRVLHWTGSAWRALPAVATPAHITGTARYLYIAAYGANPLRWDGTTWEPLPGEVRGPPTQIAAASDSMVAVLAYGLGGSLAVFDGRRFWPVWTGDRHSLYTSMWVTDRDIFLAGGNGFILHGRRID